jgi:hypothetical protein
MGNNPSTKAAAASQSALAQKRTEQIASLKRAFPQAREDMVGEGYVCYDLGVRVAHGQVKTLRIAMGPNFPVEPPALNVMPPGEHAWLDRTGLVTGYQTLQQGHWGVHHDVGKVVYEIMQEFTVNPPRYPAPGAQLHAGLTVQERPAQQQQPPQQQPLRPGMQQAGRQGAASAAGGGGRQPSPLLPQQQQQEQFQEPIKPVKHQVPMPAIPDRYPLSEKTEGELKAMAVHDKLVDRYVAEREELRALQERQAEELRSNLRKAEEVLAGEDELATLRAEVVVLLDQLADAKGAFGEKAREQGAALGRYSERNVLQRMAEAVEEADEADEADGFAGGGADVKVWQGEFLKARTQYHERRLKSARFERQQQEHRRLHQGGLRPAAGFGFAHS